MNRKHLATHWLPVFAYAALVLAVSSIPGSALARLPFSFWDKGAHIVEYGVLSFLAGRAARVMTPRADGVSEARVAFIVVAAVVAFGAIDEVYQGTRGRDADILDLAADAIGACVVQAIQSVRARGARGRRLRTAAGESSA